MTDRMKPFELRVPAGAVPDAERVLADSPVGDLVELVVDDSLSAGATVLRGMVAYDGPDD